MTLYALTLIAPPEGQSGGFSLLLMQIGLIAVVFYFLIIRPQSQARKKHQSLLDNLKKGDEVVTSGGIMGRVTDIKEERVTVQSGSSSVVVHRQRIVQVGDTAAPGTPS